VIPTCNRGELLSETLDRCLECAEGMEVEFIVIDDGSTDDTPRRLADLSLKVPNLHWRSIVKSGPSMARNLGAAIARHDILLFMGDDIQPVDSDFFRTHGALHSTNPSNDIAILGKIIWPNSNRGFVNFVMSHIQGHGGEQFGYADLVPYTNLDWRFFYTANVSIKRAIVEDWRAESFDSDFKQAAWEDIEFAYRLKKKSGSFRIFYDPTSVAMHYHRYSAAGFIERQMSVGSMAQVFFGKHPDAAQVLGFDAIIQILSSPGSTDSLDLTAEYHSIIEGLKSFVRLMDETGALETQPWHDALLAGVFDLVVGWVNYYDDPGIRSFDRFVAINAKISESFSNRFKIPKDSVDLIRHGIDTEEFDGTLVSHQDRCLIKQEFGVDANDRCFALIGRLTDQKDPLCYLAIAEGALKAKMQASFLLVGDGDLAGEVDRLIAARGLVNLRRIIYHPRPKRIYQAIDGLILTSKYEGLPIVCLEALAQRLPILATDIGDLAWAISNFGAGDVVSADINAPRIFAAFQKWNESLDNHTLEARRRSASARQEFSIKRCAAQYDACWRRAVEDKTSQLARERDIADIRRG
jgi:glycosyltransferase involved in cell wall biosynthesis